MHLRERACIFHPPPQISAHISPRAIGCGTLNKRIPIVYNVEMYLLDTLVDEKSWISGFHDIYHSLRPFLVVNIILPSWQRDRDSMRENRWDWRAQWACRHC